MTTTIFVMLPEIVLPDFVMLLATSVPMYAGMPETGGGLLPGPVVQVPPQAGGVAAGEPAKPLKDGSTGPPVRLFKLDQSDDHQVTVVAAVAAATVASPRTKTPRDGKAKMNPDAVPDEAV